MKKIDVMNIIKTRKFAVGCAAIAIAAIVATVSFQVNRGPQWPETVKETETDILPIGDELTPDEAYLGDKPVSKIKTTKNTKTSKKTVTLKAAAAKTYTKNLGTQTTRSSKTEKNGNTTIKTDTTVATNTTEKYTKKSRKKVVTTKVTTTVKTTTTVMPATAASQNTAQTASANTQSVAAPTDEPTEVSVREIAPLMPSNVINAFETLGFKVIVNPKVSYAGYFNVQDQSITLKMVNDTIYHELGHFIAFIAGNVDSTAAFKTIYGNEKEAFPGINKSYAGQNASEFFAESMRVFILQKASLRNACPNTSAALDAAVNKITDAQVAYVKKIYGGYWK